MLRQTLLYRAYGREAKMKYLVMIQARCGSTRLPNKVLKDLFGKPVLQRMIERVQHSKKVDEVVVVTSIEKNNLPILELCAKCGIRVGIGSEDDVLDRFYQTAKLLEPEYVIRLTADCPCFDYRLLDEAIEEMQPDSDYLSMLSETFPDGMDLEIMKFEALRKAWKESKHSFEREHVTQFINKRPNEFKLQDFVSQIGNYGNLRLTIDEKEDFELVEKIYKHFLIEMHNEDFSYEDIVTYLNANPTLTKINGKFGRNEGLQKSINNDKIIFNTEVD